MMCTNLYFFIDKNGGSYSDGMWHDLEFRAQVNKINLTIDGKEFITKRGLSFMIGSQFFVAGKIRLPCFMWMASLSP